MSKRGFRAGVGVVLLALGSLAPAQRALALEPGVHVDPRSPAAKEYALPLNQARGTGTSASPSSSSPEGSLFGAGIKPPSSGGSAGAGTGHSGHSARAGRAAAASPPAATTGGGSPPANVLGRLALRSSTGGGVSGSTLALIGGGVAILVLGAFGGTVLRHNRRPTS
jgi:hypothetical protein